MQVFVGRGLILQWCGIHIQIFTIGFLNILERTKDKVCQISMICWSFWRARNGLVWQSKNFIANGVVSSAITFLHQWRCAQTDEIVIGDSSSSIEHWTLPMNDTMKINVDASIVSGNGSFGVGWIARDHSDNVLETESKLITGCVQPSMVEALGVKEVLSWIKQRDLLAVTVELDCQAVVSAICHTVQMKSPFGMIISDCGRLLASLENIVILFVKLSANKAAN